MTKRGVLLTCLIAGLVCATSQPVSAQPAKPAHHAQARATVNCSISDWPFFNCLSIYGEKLNVTGFRVSRTSGGIRRTICRYSARVVVTHNGVIELTRSGGYHEGCSTYTAYVDFQAPPGGWDFPDGSEACGYFYIDDGHLTDGHPCATIHD